MDIMRRPVIAVDLCNTICDVNGALERIFGVRRKNGSMLIEGVENCFFQENPQFFLCPEVFPYAAETLQILSLQYDITYLTARPVEAYRETLQFLYHHGFPQGEVIHSDNKAAVFRERNMSFAFDDAPYEIQRYQDKDIPVFVKKWDYNQGMGIQFEWKELYRFLVYGGSLPSIQKTASI